MDDIMRLIDEFYRITKVAPRFDGIMSLATGKKVIDIFKLDKDLAIKDPDYNADACTYKGKPNYNMKDYLKERFGERAVTIAKLFLKVTPDKKKILNS